MKLFDQFSAVFSPARSQDLKPGAADWVGKTLHVQYVGEVDHECDYTGQPRFDVITPGAPMAWVPEIDLADLRPLEQ